MPKQSKISSTKPKNPSPINEEPDEFRCCRCERHFKKQKGNFPASQSPLYKANGGYLPFCNHCVDELFEHYKNVLENEADAIKRICLKFDIYWNIEIYNMLNKASTSHSRIRSYISKTNLYKYIGKSYDDTLDEETANAVISKIDNTSDNKDNENAINPELIEFWGTGFAPETYYELDKRYKKWIDSLGRDQITISEQTIYRQICILESIINRDAMEGKSIDKHVNSLNTLLGSANLKPVQKKNDENAETAIDNLPFGCGIKLLEKTRPVPQPDPDFQDVDGIIKYISIWFLGHLCKMLKIKNTYSRLYEREMEKFRVSKPEYDDEDDETLFDDIFESDGN